MIQAFSVLLLGIGLALQASTLGTTLKGGGLEVKADLAGWKQLQGPGVLHDNYVSLGLFEAGDQNLSVLVDIPPEGATNLATLCSRSLRSYGPTVKSLETSTVAQKPACMFTLPGSAGRRDLYVEMLFGDRWLELHYSAPDKGKATEIGRNALETIVGSLSATRYENKPGELLYVDIAEAEVSVAEKLQGCNAKSKDIRCKALAAFKAGNRPMGGSTPVGFAGMSSMVIFDPVGASVIDDKPVGGYIVVSDNRVGSGVFSAKLDKEKQKAEKELIEAIKNGKRPPDSNLVVVEAKAASTTQPALVSERSLIFVPGQSRIYLRETSLGMVTFALLPGARGMYIGIYMTP